MSQTPPIPDELQELAAWDGDVLVLHRTLARAFGWEWTRPVRVGDEVESGALRFVPEQVRFVGPLGGVLQIGFDGEPGISVSFRAVRAGRLTVHGLRYLARCAAGRLGVPFIDDVDDAACDAWQADPHAALRHAFRRERHLNQTAQRMRITPAKPHDLGGDQESVQLLDIRLDRQWLSDGIQRVRLDEILDAYVRVERVGLMSLRLLLPIGSVSLGLRPYSVQRYSHFVWFVGEVLAAAIRARAADEGTVDDIPDSLEAIRIQGSNATSEPD